MIGVALVVLAAGAWCARAAFVAPSIRRRDGSAVLVMTDPHKPHGIGV